MLDLQFVVALEGRAAGEKGQRLENEETDPVPVLSASWHRSSKEAEGLGVLDTVSVA